MECDVCATNGSAASFGKGLGEQAESRNPNTELLLQEEERNVPSPSASMKSVSNGTQENTSFPLELGSRHSTTSLLHQTFLLVGGVTAYGTTWQRCWLRTALLCYVLLIACGSLAWMVVHSYYVLRYNDSNLTFDKHLPRYSLVYAVAFCLPSVDGVVNLLFAHFELYCSRRSGQALTVSSMVGSDSLQKHRFTKDRVLRIALLCTLCLIVFRIFCVWLWLQWGMWLILGLVIEVLPHIAPFIVMYGETSNMAGRLQTLTDNILANRMDPRKCIDEYKNFSHLVQRRSNRWQVFIVLSVGMEVYIVVFQTLFGVLSGSEVYDSEKVSMNVTSFTLIEGCYMMFKLWPIVRYNARATKFAKTLLLRAQEVEEKGELPVEAEDSEKFQRSVWTTSMLFSTNPPCLTIFTFVIDKVTIMAMTFSVTFAAISRHLWKVADV